MITIALQRESIQPRIDGIQKDILLLQQWSALFLTEFSQPEILDRVHHHLRLALEGVFNITSHILSRIPGARETEYKRMAKKLGELKIVDAAFADSALVAMAGYRNRLTHFYADIDARELHEITKNHLHDIEIFLVAIRALMEHPEKFRLTLN